MIRTTIARGLLPLALSGGAFPVLAAEACTRERVERALEESVERMEIQIDALSADPAAVNALYRDLSSPEQMAILDPHEDELGRMLNNENLAPSLAMCRAIDELIDYYDRVLDEHAR